MHELKVLRVLSNFSSFLVPKFLSQGRIRTLHRNLLLPVGYISQTPEEEKLKPIPKPRTRFQKKQRKHTPRSSVPQVKKLFLNFSPFHLKRFY
jgi:hypothetical protein